MKLLNNLVATVCVVAALGGCATMRPTTVRQEIPVVHPADPTPIESKPVEFQVWDSKKVAAVAKDPSAKDKIWYVLDSMGVKNLNDNILESIRYIQQDQSIVAYYKDVIDGYNASVKSVAAKKAEAATPAKKDKPGF